jgi:hypothetical protein
MRHQFVDQWHSRLSIEPVDWVDGYSLVLSSGSSIKRAIVGEPARQIFYLDQYFIFPGLPIFDGANFERSVHRN